MSPKETKAHLIQEALIYFASHDYERSSLDDIAKILGVTKGAIYHHFKNKDELFKEAVRMLFEILVHFMLDGIKDVKSFEGYMKTLFNLEGMMEMVGEESGLAAMLSKYENVMYMFLAGIKKFPELKSELSEVYSRFINELIVLMNRCAFAGEIRKDADFEAVAYEITAYYEGTILLGAISGNPQFTALIPRVCDEILRRLKTDCKE
jgi:TetR/AcrR family transcriptional regulator, transcriptional repressor for nem operon